MLFKILTANIMLILIAAGCKTQNTSTTSSEYTPEECADKLKEDSINARDISSCYVNSSELTEWMKRQGGGFYPYCLCSFRSAVLPQGKSSCKRVHYPSYRLVRINDCQFPYVHLVDADPANGIQANHIPAELQWVQNSSGIGEGSAEVIVDGKVVGITHGGGFNGVCMDSQDNGPDAKCTLVSTDLEFSIKWPTGGRAEAKKRM